jgi:hypothetical protein
LVAKFPQIHQDTGEIMKPNPLPAYSSLQRTFSAA